jgi:hypothetical protein
VFGIVQRGGKAQTYHFPQMNRWQIAEKLKGDISLDAKALYTDDGRFYRRVPENIKKHEIVNHSAKEWVRGDVHTGTIDGYWGLLKRGTIGSFHKVSIKHLHRYLSEFRFRWNNREAQDMFPLVIAALVIGNSDALRQAYREDFGAGAIRTFRGRPLLEVGTISDIFIGGALRSCFNTASNFPLSTVTFFTVQ